MNTGADGIALMHYFEACKLSAYPDPATGGEPITIGWGHTAPGLKLGTTITQQEADELFAKRLAREFEPGVTRLLTRDPKPCQFDAMVSLAYNIGLGNFSKSTALRKFNMGDIDAAAIAIRSWDKAAGKTMKGLQRRRWAESKVFGGWTAQRSIADALTTYP
jgi:lysozyme